MPGLTGTLNGGAWDGLRDAATKLPPICGSVKVAKEAVVIVMNIHDASPIAGERG